MGQGQGGELGVSGRADQDGVDIGGGVVNEQLREQDLQSQGEAQAIAIYLHHGGIGARRV